MPQQTWLDKADRYLLSAQILLNEGDVDSCISRAYYGARYAAIHLLIARRMGWQASWQHRTISDKMAEQARNLLWLRGLLMSGQTTFTNSWTQLLDYRSRADYELGRTNERIAQRSLAFAQAFVEAVKENS
jgi:uncharacterized protein (UPF0332 family)